jgi:hypothetical protein
MDPAGATQTSNVPASLPLYHLLPSVRAGSLRFEYNAGKSCVRSIGNKPHLAAGRADSRAKKNSRTPRISGAGRAHPPHSPTHCHGPRGKALDGSKPRTGLRAGCDPGQLTELYVAEANLVPPSSCEPARRLRLRQDLHHGLLHLGALTKPGVWTPSSRGERI